MTPSSKANAAASPVADRYARPLQDLRISLTDRCNFRCTYCMPRELFGSEHLFLPRRELLDFEEIERLARIAASLGVSKLRLTGGEPLLRRDIDVLIARLADIDGIDDICLTTNGSLLTEQRARDQRPSPCDHSTETCHEIRRRWPG